MERCTVAVTGTIGHGETIRHMIDNDTATPSRAETRAAVRGRSSSDLARTIQHASSAELSLAMRQAMQRQRGSCVAFQTINEK